MSEPTAQIVPTPEQEAIIERARSTQDNILISALAGAAKTSTLTLIFKALPSSLPILSVAFNKRIAEEMQSRFPGNVKSSTLNSLGHRIWASTTGRRLVVNTKKSFDILREVIPRRADVNFSEHLNALKEAKIQGYVPEGTARPAQSLITDEDFYSNLEDEVVPAYIDEALRRSITAGYTGAVDYDDQIYLSTFFGSSFPQFPLLGVDEVQDLSPLNHAMLSRLVSRRIIAVGDPYQSIYAFRGAHPQSMRTLRDQFNMVELPLSISFRCPRAVVELAQRRAPSMRYPEWAIQGRVEELEFWSAANIEDGAAIICRNNAPLFKCAMQLIRMGRGVKLVGTELGPQLVKALKKLGPESLTQAEALAAVDLWQAEKTKKGKALASIADRADCFRVFIQYGQTLSEAIAYAEHLFSTTGPILLMSGHKSKGLEFDTVYHLDPWRIPSQYSTTREELEQESNVEYVITTRAKRNLFLVNLENLNA